MLNILSKILLTHPKLSLILTLLYVAGLWYITYALWHMNGAMFAIVFFILMSLVTRVGSKPLIQMMLIEKNRKRQDN